jgi:hypothetical protein
MGSSGLASKPVVTVFSGLTSKPMVTVSPDLASKLVMSFLVEPQNQGDDFSVYPKDWQRCDDGWCT